MLSLPNPFKNFNKPVESKVLALPSATAPVATPVRAVAVVEHVETYENVQKPTQHKQQPKNNLAKSKPEWNDPNFYWQQPKRIQKLYELSLKGASGNAQIEGVKVNGLWAKIFLQFYETQEGQRKAALVGAQMGDVFVLINNMIEKGKLTLQA